MYLIVCTYTFTVYMFIQGTAEKQLLLMLSPCLNSFNKKTAAKARFDEPLDSPTPHP